MSRVIPITGALVAVMLSTAQGALAQDTTGSPWRTVRPQPNVLDTGTTASASDTATIRQVIRGSLTEVGLGRMTESHAENSEVKDFGERMVNDHNSMNEEWSGLARANGMRLDLNFGTAGQQTIDRLDDLEGTEFDQAYMTEMIRQHEQDLATFQRIRSSAGSSEVRELANDALPTIQQHLILARQIGSRVGVATTAGRVGDVDSLPAPLPSETDRTRREADREDRDERDNRDRGALRAEDRAFVQNVLQAHMMEIRLAERARREATSNETRRLAERLEDDFKDWQEHWLEVAKQLDVLVPSNLGPKHKEKVDRLERTSKRNIDRTYAELVADHMEAVLPYFRKEGQEVQPAAVRRLVDDELPLIREHLGRARRLEEQLRDR